MTRDRRADGRGMSLRLILPPTHFSNFRKDWSNIRLHRRALPVKLSATCRSTAGFFRTRDFSGRQLVSEFGPETANVSHLAVVFAELVILAAAGFRNAMRTVRTGPRVVRGQIGRDHSSGGRRIGFLIVFAPVRRVGCARDRSSVPSAASPIHGPRGEKAASGAVDRCS